MPPKGSGKETHMYCTLDFDGYWAVPSSGVAAFSGIYCVYAFAWPDIFNLLYIGEANDVETRVARHERRGDWKRTAKGDALYFSAAKVSAPQRRQVEAAMINQHQPPCNVECREEFPFSATHIVAVGKCANLDSNFEISND